MNKQRIINQVKPEIVKGKVRLPNQAVRVGANAVGNSGKQTPIKEIIRNLKKAAKEQLFPPIVTPQNG